jgi:hypothetical protein
MFALSKSPVEHQSEILDFFIMEELYFVYIDGRASRGLCNVEDRPVNSAEKLSGPFARKRS